MGERAKPNIYKKGGPQLKIEPKRPSLFHFKAELKRSAFFPRFKYNSIKLNHESEKRGIEKLLFSRAAGEEI